jgi:hypothetical protein
MQYLNHNYTVRFETSFSLNSISFYNRPTYLIPLVPIRFGSDSELGTQHVRSTHCLRYLCVHITCYVLSRLCMGAMLVAVLVLVHMMTYSQL